MSLQDEENMGNENKMIETQNSNQTTIDGWKVGDKAFRKGKLCQIIKIDFQMHPPSVVVKMLDDNTEVNTEFTHLSVFRLSFFFFL